MKYIEMGNDYVRYHIITKNLGYKVSSFIIDPDIIPSIIFNKQMNNVVF